jgi:hypothetical protein
VAAALSHTAEAVAAVASAASLPRHHIAVDTRAEVGRAAPAVRTGGATRGGRMRSAGGETVMDPPSSSESDIDEEAWEIVRDILKEFPAVAGELRQVGFLTEFPF